MRGCELAVGLGAARPDHHAASAAVGLEESLDVLAERFGDCPSAALLDVGTINPLDPVWVEGRRHRADRLQLGPKLFDQAGIEDPRLQRGFVGIVGEGIPGAEADSVEGREREHLAQRGAGSTAFVEQVSELVIEPTGEASLRFTASIPAIAVVATAPSPGSSTANR